ncbi:ECF-type sigma factor [Xanthomonadaceae bacterium JHOS43]|nr:ECF-type sigma factor [Xanthomonadaceae bacterium JHOS43]MCX7563034.1 ECF-type sigma factor [Xanthomonadaceae bacterium XH05]
MNTPLPAHRATDDPALQSLVQIFYADLRRIARRERFRVGAGATLCTTALISEAWLKLQRASVWHNERHFLATAALAMRQVLVGDAEMRRAAKRNGGQVPLSLDESIDAPDDAADEQILLVNDALDRLAQLSPRLAQVVECRFFAGYNEAETAHVLNVTDRTVRRDWVKARAWLYRELGEQTPSTPGDA